MTDPPVNPSDRPNTPTDPQVIPGWSSHQLGEGEETREGGDGGREHPIIPLLRKFSKGKALCNTYLSSIAPSHLHIVCMNLRNHGVLPPPGQADGEQVIDGGGVLQAGLASLRLVWKTTDDRLATRLDGRADKMRSDRMTYVSVFYRGGERSECLHSPWIL